MPELSPEQLKQLQRLARVLDNGNIGTIENLIELEEALSGRLDELSAGLLAIRDEIAAIELKEGVPGRDADEEAIVHQVLRRMPRPTNGKDADERRIIKSVLQQIRIPEDGKDAEVDYNLIVSEVLKRVPEPENGKDGSPDFADDIRDKLELLPEPDKLSIDAIAGLRAWLESLSVREKGIVMGANRALYQLLDMNLAGITPGQSIEWNGTQWLPYTPGGGSSSVYNDSVSGTIDGVNTIFTVPNIISSPIFLSLSNSNYQAGIDYSVTGPKQITFVTAPDSSLAGQPFWFAHT